MPYRLVTLPSANGSYPETVWVRISDAAIAAWLTERWRLGLRFSPGSSQLHMRSARHEPARISRPQSGADRSPATLSGRSSV